MTKLSDINLLIGRIIIAVYFFIFGALLKIFTYNSTLQYMIEHDVPLTHLALILTIIIQFICSVSILIGMHSRIAAFILVLLTIIINFYMHDFWNMSESIEQRHELQNFVKNTGIIAGLLVLSAVNPGKYSLRQ